MGQYQQWLLAQNISQRLKTEVETLETELLYLKDRMAILEQAVPETENVILLALQSYLRPSIAIEGAPELEEKQVAEGVPGGLDQAAWGELPASQGPVAEPSLSFFSPSQASVEGDTLTFFDGRKQTDARLMAALPQSDYARLKHTEGEEHPVDKETRRLNENIQRWFDRWHRQMRGMSRTVEVPDER